jgi:hypothetical protein
VTHQSNVLISFFFKHFACLSGVTYGLRWVFSLSLAQNIKKDFFLKPMEFEAFVQIDSPQIEIHPMNFKNILRLTRGGSIGSTDTVEILI